MVKKYTLLVDRLLERQLTAQAAARGFANRSDYLRFLIRNDNPAGGGHSVTEREAGLDRIEVLLEEWLEELRRFSRDLSVLDNVGLKALTVLLAFHDIESIPRQGLERAREFIRRKLEETDKAE